MSLSKVLLADNSQNACALVGASILQNDEADLLYGDSLLNQLDEFTRTDITLNPSGSTNEEDSIPENNTMVQNDSNGSGGRKKKTKQGKKKETETKVWKCQECSKEFPQQFKLTRHLCSHSDKRNYQCEVCGKAFRQQSSLCHHRVVHSTVKPYSCSICKKSYNRATTLNRHRKIHEEEKSYQCSHCPKAFHQKANLKHHIFTHTKELPYTCGICGKRFNQSSNLASHLKVHANKIEQRFECNICGKSFKRLANCQKHEQNDHVDIMEEPPSQSTTDRSIIADRDCDDIGDLPEDTIKLPIDPINTDAMLIAQALNQQPHMVLVKPLDGSPVVARVEEDCEQQMLVPIKWTDLCPYTQIINSTESEREQDNPDAIQKYKLQIKIPIVATMQEAPADEEPTAILSDDENESR